MLTLKGLAIIWGIAAVFIFCAWGLVDLLKTITLWLLPEPKPWDGE
jgi:hypothetical protein